MRLLYSRKKVRDIKDMFVGICEDGQPFLVSLEGEIFLPIFTLQSDLVEMAKKVLIKPQIITNSFEFLESVKGIRLMLDPWVTKCGTTRFTELK